MNRKLFRLIFGLLIFSLLSCQKETVQKQILFEAEDTLQSCSFRGSAMGEKHILLSGSYGVVYKYNFQNKSWIKIENPEFDSLDFRDVEILNENDWVLMSSGNGKESVVFRTKDAGKAWEKTFENKYDQAFFNGMDFWTGMQGVIISDPIDEKAYMLKTDDGGMTWNRLANDQIPILEKGEYGFAASGSGIQTFGEGYLRIATGGDIARIFSSNDYGENWEIQNLPIVQGVNSKGIYSIDYYNENLALAAGGDWMIDSLKGNNLVKTENGFEWNSPVGSMDLGFISCVKFLTMEIVLATGTYGTAVSYDSGNTWEYRSQLDGYHTIAFNTKSGRGILAGGKGRVRIFNLK